MHKISDKEILNIVKPYEPEYLYKYRTIGSIGLERIFTHKEIYLSDPTKFNDPFDCKPRLTIHKSEYKKKQYYKSIVKNRFPNATKYEINKELRTNPRIRKLKDMSYIEDMFIDFIKGFGIYCLSEVPDDILMWSHYSDSHKGICLQFNAVEESSIIWEAFKVNYQHTYPEVNVMKMGDVEQFFKLFATKSKHWDYEKERRIIMTPEDGGSKSYSFKPNLLTGVILGAKISPDNEELVLSWVKEMETNVEIYKAVMNTRSYDLDIKGVNC